VAKLAQSGSRQYYLVLLRYNIPTLKAFLIPGKYSFARFSTRFVVYSTYKDQPDKEFREQSAHPKKVDLLSIYPVNDLLDVQHTEKGTNTIHVEPKYQEASAGYYEYSKERTDQYNFELPKVVGSADRYGSAAWTYYPAKLQPLIMGSKTAMAIVSFDLRTPAELSAKANFGYMLRLESTLDYQLKRLWALPGMARSVKDVVEFDLRQAPGLDGFLQVHKVDLPDEIVSKVNELRDVHQYVVSSGKNDYVVDVTEGKFYQIDNGGTPHVVLPPQSNRNQP
jgi:hypothetical protein